MFITRASSLLNPGLCLGGFLVTLPHFTASIQTNYNYTYPDGSICYVCQFESTSEYDQGICWEFFLRLETKGSDIYCTAAGGACDGDYIPADVGDRDIDHWNKCLYRSFDRDKFREENCCFKPGSTVCISNFLVHYGGLMLGLELV